MRFGKTLRNSIYEPWRAHYIDYGKLKRLLREDEAETDAPSSRGGSKVRQWTEDDESTFVDELVNSQLEKVNGFHAETISRLRERTTECESRLEKYNGAKDSQPEQAVEEAEEEDTKRTLHSVLEKLDSITEQVNELEKYSRINYTGFLKAAKKHDRRRGSQYKVRPLLQVRLAALPFNSEDYSPLLYR